MNKKLVLIDFDGVILRNQHASNLIAKRAGLYTWHSLQSRQKKYHNFSVGLNESVDLCANLYKGYGHTLLGLKNLNLNTSLHDYNKYVYSDINYEKLVMHNNNMHDVHKLVNECNENNIPILMFSNSPKIWIENMLSCQPILFESIVDVRDTLHIKDDDDIFLKPNIEIYNLISKVFYNYNLIFIDDSVGNIKTSLSNPQWTNVLFGGINEKINNNLYLINSLEKTIEIF